MKATVFGTNMPVFDILGTFRHRRKLIFLVIHKFISKADWMTYARMTAALKREGFLVIFLTVPQI